MQLTFDPANEAECGIVAGIIDAIHGTGTKTSGPALDPSAPTLSLAAAGIGTDVGQDNRDPAAVFAGNAAPLGVGAPAFPNAQGVPSAGAQMPLPGAQPSVPPAPAPASAPSTPAAGTTHVNGVEVDSTGLPWDARIHASTKSKTKAGQWVAKRGMNDGGALQRQVEAELRATMAIPQGGGAPLGGATPAPQTAPPAMQPAMNGPASSGVPARPAAMLPAASPQLSPAPAAPPALPSASATPTTFDELMPRVTAAVGTAVPEGAVEWAVTQVGLQNLVGLIQRPDLVPQVWAVLKQAYPALQ